VEDKFRNQDRVGWKSEIRNPKTAKLTAKEHKERKDNKIRAFLSCSLRYFVAFTEFCNYLWHFGFSNKGDGSNAVFRLRLSAAQNGFTFVYHLD
jgi:hypothetical protein